MTFDLHKILESKRALRRNLAARPIGEKLRMLDALRERELALRGRAPNLTVAPGALREDSAPYRTKPQ
jgi:hypothetical protein